MLSGSTSTTGVLKHQKIQSPSYLPDLAPIARFTGQRLDEDGCGVVETNSSLIILKYFSDATTSGPGRCIVAGLSYSLAIEVFRGLQGLILAETQF